MVKANKEYVIRKKYGPEKALTPSENEWRASRGVFNGIYCAIMDWAKCHLTFKILI